MKWWKQFFTRANPVKGEDQPVPERSGAPFAGASASRGDHPAPAGPTETAEPSPAEALFQKGLRSENLARSVEAYETYGQVLALDPSHANARARLNAMSQFLKPHVNRHAVLADRNWNTGIQRETLISIQANLFNYRYRGVTMLKNPFDIALYPMLLWQLKPMTIIEIGSQSGGSALWFGDLLNNIGVDGHIYSIDVVKVDSVSHPRVTFMAGDGRNLATCLSESFLAQLPKPWLVIEDADHQYETSIAALRFFHQWLQPGDYIVVEDGIISDLVEIPGCNSGPHQALKEFLGVHANEYEMDVNYCDFFGHNFTWCTNGFLRRKTAEEQSHTEASHAAA